MVQAHVVNKGTENRIITVHYMSNPWNQEGKSQTPLYFY